MTHDLKSVKHMMTDELYEGLNKLTDEELTALVMLWERVKKDNK